MIVDTPSSYLLHCRTFNYLPWLCMNMKENSNGVSVALSLPRSGELTERLKDHVRKQLRKMKRTYQRSVRRSDPAAVHDLRVATRRLGTVLDVVAFCTPRKAAKKARKRLKKLRHMLSARRDIDVLLKKMQERARAAVSRRRKHLWNVVIRETRNEGETARKKSKHWLKSFDIDRLEEQIRTIVHQHLKGDFPWSDLSAAAHHAEQKLKQTAEQARAASDSSGFHEVRIKTKTFRYLVELVPRILGDDRSDSRVEWLKNIQDELGEWHDEAELCRRLTAILSGDAGLQADPIATAIIDAARNRTRLNDERARRTIDSLGDVKASEQAGITADLDGAEPLSDR